jgi:hypothetical protein
MKKLFVRRVAMERVSMRRLDVRKMRAMTKRIPNAEHQNDRDFINDSSPTSMDMDDLFVITGGSPNLPTRPRKSASTIIIGDSSSEEDDTSNVPAPSKASALGSRAPKERDSIQQLLKKPASEALKKAAADALLAIKNAVVKPTPQQLKKPALTKEKVEDASPSRLSKEERELLRLAVQKAAIIGEARGRRHHRLVWARRPEERCSWCAKIALLKKQLAEVEASSGEEGS